MKERGAVADFCRKTGFSRASIQRWEAGQYPTLETLERIAEGLGTTAWDLIKPETAEEKPKSPLVLVQGGSGDTLRELLAVLPRLKEDKLRLLLRAALIGQVDQSDESVKSD